MVKISINSEEAAKAGIDLGKAMGSVGKFVVRHPVATLSGIGAIGALGYLLNRANQLRGAHQILNEANKTGIMNYQTQLLSQIAKNQQQQPNAAAVPQQQIIIPPLR